jgi:hypothetical protein
VAVSMMIGTLNALLEIANDREPVLSGHIEFEDDEVGDLLGR